MIKKSQYRKIYTESNIAVSKFDDEITAEDLSTATSHLYKAFHTLLDRGYDPREIKDYLDGYITMWASMELLKNSVGKSKVEVLFNKGEDNG